MAAAVSTRTGVGALQLERPLFPQGLRVLLVEPASSSNATKRLLDGLNYEVMAVSDFPSATTALQGQSTATACSFDVVLADAVLPGDGLQQLFTAAGAIPVVLMGHSYDPSDVLQAVESGAADFLERPLLQLKLKNLWQHTVRRMMSGGSSRSNPRTAGAVNMQADRSSELQCRQQYQAHPLMGDCCDLQEAGPDCLDGLQLPELLPAQLAFDPDSIFMDLDCPAQDEPSIDDILQTSTSPEGSAATTDIDLFGGYSSDQYGCSSGATFFQTSMCELESCADTASRVPSLSFAVGTSGSHYHASLKSLGSCINDTPAACSTPAPAYGSAVQGSCAMPHMQMAAMHSNSYYWGAPTGVRGMVWGMPVPNVTKVPGIVVSPPNMCNGGDSSNIKDSAAIGSCQLAGQQAGSSHVNSNGGSNADVVPAVQAAPAAGVPSVMQPATSWQSMMSMMMSAGMLYPSMAFAGMPYMPMPPMGGCMGALPPMCMPPMAMLGMPCAWPAAAAQAVPATMAPSTTAAELTAAAPAAAGAQQVLKPSGVQASSGCSYDTAAASAGMCRTGSVEISKSGSGTLCVDSLFAADPAEDMVC